MDKRRLLLIVVCSFASAYGLHVASSQLSMSRGIDARLAVPAAASAVSAASRSLRPNYPYSVIPGGAYSPAELRFADGHDGLVKDHYADFDIKSARLVRLTEDRFQYVSYRLRDQIYWTNKKLRIPKGEVLLTDGYNFARTRCGNRLSSTPRPNTTPEQPSERALSLPPFSPAQLRGGEVNVAPAPPPGELAQIFPDLPFDLPRLAPYVPAQAIGSMPLAQQIGTPISTYPSAVGPLLAGLAPTPTGFATLSGGAPNSPPGRNSPPISVPGTPGTITASVPPGFTLTPAGLPIAINTTAPPINEVPEPASLSLFTFGVCVSLGLLARMMRGRVRTED